MKEMKAMNFCTKYTWYLKNRWQDEIAKKRKNKSKEKKKHFLNYSFPFESLNKTTTTMKQRIT